VGYILHLAPSTGEIAAWKPFTRKTKGLNKDISDFSVDLESEGRLLKTGELAETDQGISIAGAGLSARIKTRRKAAIAQPLLPFRKT